MQNNNSILKEVLKEICVEETESLPAEKDIDHEFSDDFDNKMDKLIKKESRNNSFVHKAGKKIAIIILIVLICALSAFTVKTDALHNLFDFIYYFYDSFFVMETSRDHETSANMVFYSLSYLPDGFEQTSCRISTSSNIHWRNKEGESISLFQHSKSSLAVSMFNTLNHPMEETEINSIRAFYCDTGKRISCMWEDSDYTYHLTYSSSLGREFAEKSVGKLIVIQD